MDVELSGASYSRAVESLLNPPILFGRRPARDHAPGGELATYGRAVTLGATGIEASAWSTADGVVVVHDRGSVGGALRRRPIRDVLHSALPAGLPTLESLYGLGGADLDIALDVADAASAEAAIHTAQAVAGDEAVRHLWLANPDWELLGAWRERWADVRLANRTRLRGLDQGPERRAAQLAAAGIDAVILHHSEWTGGLTTLFHRFGRLAFASDASHGRIMRELLRMGIDGVSSEQVERVVGTLGRDGH